MYHLLAPSGSCATGGVRLWDDVLRLASTLVTIVSSINQVDEIIHLVHPINLVGETAAHQVEHLGLRFQTCK